MSTFLEAFLSLLPTDVGGRQDPITPRDGTYCPSARSSAGDALRIRLIEGPPLIAPGQDARVVVEAESEVPLVAGCELDVLEQERVIGLMTVTRILSAPLPSPR